MLTKLYDWQRQAIADAFGAGEKSDSVAAEFGITRQRVGQIGQEFGHPSRGVGRPKSKVFFNAMLSTSPIGTAAVIG